jgi:hypothetical protein
MNDRSTSSGCFSLWRLSRHGKQKLPV